MKSSKIVPQDGTMYLEFSYGGSILTIDPKDPRSGVLTIVRCGPGEVNERGVERPMRYREGQRVILGPRSAIQTPRGFLAHQNDVLAVVEEWDGEDEMRSKPVSGAVKPLSMKEAKLLACQPVGKA